MSAKFIKTALKVKPRRLGKGPHHVKAVRVEALHKGALHKMLNIPMNQTIPLWMLHVAVKRPEKFFDDVETQELLRQRAQFALNVHGLGHGKRTRSGRR